MAYAGKNFGGFKVMAGLIGGPGGGATRTLENFRKFAKNSLRKLQRMQYFCLLCTKISKLCVKFSCIWTKNTIGCGNFEKILKFFGENSIENLNFCLFLEKLLLKIEPSEITSFFYNNFSRFGGGVDPPPS